MIEKVQALKEDFLQRLRALHAEEQQAIETLERVRTARIAQEGAIRGLEILMERIGDGNNELSGAGE